MSNFDGDWYVRIHIYGGADRIPNRVKRKKVVNTQTKNIYRATLKIEIEGLVNITGLRLMAIICIVYLICRLLTTLVLSNENVIHWTKS